MLILNGATSDARLGSDSQPAKILQLPYEIHCEIVRHLSLSSLYIYQTQTCRTLRYTFAGKLIVHRPHAFHLVEWHRAALEVQELVTRQQDRHGRSSARPVSAKKVVAQENAKPRKSIWDTSPSATPKPATMPVPPVFPALNALHQGLLATAAASQPLFLPAKLRQSDSPLESCVPYADDKMVALFIRCMHLLNITNKEEPPSMPLLHLAKPSSSTPLRSLSLLSRTGFRVAALTQLLSTLPGLEAVETVLLTSAGSADLLVWFLYNPQCARHSTAPQTTTSANAMTIPQRSFVETQAIVVPGPRAVRGRGMRSGYKCLCFHPRDPEIILGDAIPVFHVILHDWYNEFEAMATEEMLHESQITCNACKKEIVF